MNTISPSGQAVSSVPSQINEGEQVDSNVEGDNAVDDGEQAADEDFDDYVSFDITVITFFYQTA